MRLGVVGGRGFCTGFPLYPLPFAAAAGTVATQFSSGTSSRFIFPADGQFFPDRLNIQRFHAEKLT